MYSRQSRPGSSSRSGNQSRPGNSSHSAQNGDAEVCAELEIYHSRLVAPTRRVALGAPLSVSTALPDDFGAVLLGCVAGWFAQGQDEEFFTDAAKLLAYVSTKTPIPQPHMRYRFQKDLVGLLASSHQICEEAGFGSSILANLSFVSEMKSSTPAQHVLGALYAAYHLDEEAHWQSCEMIELALEWAVERPPGSLEGTSTRLGITGVQTDGGDEPERSELLGLLVKSTGSLGTEWRSSFESSRGGRSVGSWSSAGRSGSDSGSSFGSRSSGSRNKAGSHKLSSLTLAHRWAMNVMEFEEHEVHSLSEAKVQDRFRQLLRAAHPDSGGNPKEAPARISDLSEARQILTS